MTSLTDTIKELREFNEWRRGSECDMPDPKKIGLAIDAVCNIAEKAEQYEKSLNEVVELSLKHRGDPYVVIGRLGEIAEKSLAPEQPEGDKS